MENDLNTKNEQLEVLQKTKEVISQDTTTKISQIDQQIKAISNSTKTTFPFMIPVHNTLRMKLKWYYKWHLSPIHEYLHAFVLILVVAFVYWQINVVVK